MKLKKKYKKISKLLEKLNYIFGFRNHKYKIVF